ncbi:MAG TPA: hypothetical protein VK603_08110 [Candidatus Saccharimonadales bacterium]|nr:hypothetical protein [Candidatus Saccharimonadales bacterium]
MEIVSLRFVVTEDDLNSLLVKFVTAPPKIRDLHFRVMPDVLSLAGVYETVLRIPFDSEWKFFVQNGRIVARLAAIKVIGIGLGFLKGYVLKALSSNSTVLEFDEESVVFDVDHFFEQMAVPIKTNLLSVCCESGRLVIECDRQARRD